MPSWKDLEEKVRTIAECLYSRKAESRLIAGEQIDCYIEKSAYEVCAIEITENFTLEKVRADIRKLDIVRRSNINKNIFTHCLMVLDREPSDNMKNTAAELNIEIISVEKFECKFVDYKTYKYSRRKKTFGSAVDPLTGKLDDLPYVPVKYVDKKKNENYSIEDIKNYLDKGKVVILTGSFGSGKSRCLSEVFSLYSAENNYSYAFGINLRENWSLKRANEIIRRHFEDLSFSPEQVNHSTKLLDLPNVVFLLDGFDEVGSQKWSSEPAKLQDTKKDALVGVRDLIQKAKGGILITGRENYFTSDKEMFSFLGIKENTSILISCKDEFSNDEMQEYMKNINLLDLSIPDWAPRKPLIFHLISTLKDSGLIINGEINNEIEFWNKLIDFICEREANINNSVLDSRVIKKVLMGLSNLTRKKPMDTGPITLSEFSQVFAEVTGRNATDESAIMLARIPSIGRVSNDSLDYQFIDDYILDGLRADFLVENYDNHMEINRYKDWINPIKSFGQRLVFEYIKNQEINKVISKISLYSKNEN
ncbi:NACHT domain-containing protein, partial [Dickeya fangzhongdai]|uniref:NACHT domain-containing protein n=2 Tax=Pectobacteriaceae TaxID=1903410 RepID=UPI001ADB1E86